MALSCCRRLRRKLVPFFSSFIRGGNRFSDGGVYRRYLARASI